MLARLRKPWPDTRAERLLGAVSCLVGVLVVGMVVFVAVHAWPTFQHNGLSWLTSGESPENSFEKMQATGVNAHASAYHLRAWPLLYGTLLITVVSVAVAFVVSVFASIFIVELAPERLRKVTIPVIRLLASVPSVVYGLLGVLVLVPFVGNHLITGSEKASVANEIELTGAGLLVTVVILTVMISPIMIALTCEALTSVPNSWREGAIALGLNPLRAILSVTVRAARPAIVAAAVLATARALGEAIMISMVSGSRAFKPNLDHGLLVFLYSPLRTFASTIVDFREGISAPALGSSLYAIALLLLLGGFVLSVCGYLIKLPMRKYQVRG